jgi:plastocyanin
LTLALEPDVTRRPRLAGPIAFAVVATGLLAGGCREESPPPAFPPDSVLRDRLGLTDEDEVHRVSITGGDREVVEPVELEVPPGAWVEFVTTDWRVHRILFLGDSLDAGRLAFLVSSDQMDSPPLIDRDARFVVSFVGAPEGRFPYVVEGNGASTHGVVVVRAKR